MFKKILVPLLIVSSLNLMVLSLNAFAEDSVFDGKDTLLCTVMNTRQCELDGCRLVDSEDIGVPQHILADFKKKRMTSTEFSGLNIETPIGNVTREDNRLFVRGIDENAEAPEDAVAWSMVVADPTGMMTLTIGSEEVAFVSFGACVPLE